MSTDLPKEPFGFDPQKGSGRGKSPNAPATRTELNQRANLAWAFTICDRSVKRLLAERFENKPSFVSHLLSGETKLQAAHLEAAAEIMLLKPKEGSPSPVNLPSVYSPDIWTRDHSAFDLYLRTRQFGKYKGMSTVLEWIETVERQPCRLIDAETIVMLGVTYRSFGRPVPVYSEPAESDAVIGRRYGVLVDIPPGPVLDAVRERKAAALVVHHDRVVDTWDVVPLDVAEAKATITELPESGPAKEDPMDRFLGPSGESRSYSPCVLAGSNGGEMIEGNPGLRELYVFVFVAACMTNSIRKAMVKGTHAFDSDFGHRLRYAVEQGSNDGTVVAMRTVYEAVRLPAS